MSKSRREFLQQVGAGAAVLAAASANADQDTKEIARQQVAKLVPPDYDILVIGSGFGATMVGLSLARRLRLTGSKLRIHMLERGVWWTTPVDTVQDPNVKTAFFLREKKKQPVQYWASADHFKGLVDMFLRCLRRPNHEDGLYDLTTFGKRNDPSANDGVTVARASGVGGGSLIYANVTIQPPDFIFDDEAGRRAWPLGWTKEQRAAYFDMARKAIGRGVLYARNLSKSTASGIVTQLSATSIEVEIDEGKGGPDRLSLPRERKAFALAANTDLDKDTRVGQPVWVYTDGSGAAMQVVVRSPLSTNTGLSNIATRTARLDPQFVDAAGTKRIDTSKKNRNWIARSRVFQIAMSKITGDYGAVNSSINDVTPEPNPIGPEDKEKNYCERQGRCIVGCLPGARHTLNKQLMRSVLGAPNPNFDPTQPDSPQNPEYLDGFFDGQMSIETLAEVRTIHALPEGGYEVRYWSRNADQPKNTLTKVIRARHVVVSAGTVGTNEILLRSKAEGGLPNLSDKVGFGFSTNGDYLAFLEKTDQVVNLTHGPVTTSFGHFESDTPQFHTIEDNGIPKAFSVLVGNGVSILKSLAKKGGPDQKFLAAIIASLFKQLVTQIKGFFDRRFTGEAFRAEDLSISNMMCIAAMGRESAVGQFRLGGKDDTPLRVSRTDGVAFSADPIYARIQASLKAFAAKLSKVPENDFISPFFQDAKPTVASSHPLGGCRIAANVTGGVCDEFGRVFDKSKSGAGAVYPGLYVADGSMIPSALGVNPSLTISALSLRVADKLCEELQVADPDRGMLGH
jgi:choline dehydrogenase-like flavoprotein